MFASHKPRRATPSETKQNALIVGLAAVLLTVLPAAMARADEAEVGPADGAT